MPSGGARATSGPPPDPNALRRDRDGGDWELLPSAGRKGKPPAWPLSRPTARETDLWKREWKRPQAVKWAENGQEIEVAMYVRTLVAAEKRDAPVTTRNLLRQQQEALGISLPGMSRLRWKIEPKEVTAKRTNTSAAAPTGRKGARERFSVVNGGKS